MFQIFISVAGVLVALLIVWLVRKDRLRVGHGLSWLVVALGFAFLGLAPGLMDFIAYRLGIAYPPVLAFTLAIIVIVVKLLLMDIESSRLAMRQQRLTQRIAMLEADIRRIEESPLEGPSEGVGN